MGEKLHPKHDQLIQAGFVRKRSGPDASAVVYIAPAERSRRVIEKGISEGVRRIQETGIDRATVSGEVLDKRTNF